VRPTFRDPLPPEPAGPISRPLTIPAARDRAPRPTAGPSCCCPSCCFEVDP